MDLVNLDNDVKSARQHIADIAKAGSEIYDGLAKEAALKEARQRAIAKHTDRVDVERAIEVWARLRAVCAPARGQDDKTAMQGTLHVDES